MKMVLVGVALLLLILVPAVVPVVVVVLLLLLVGLVGLVVVGAADTSEKSLCKYVAVFFWSPIAISSACNGTY